MIKTPTIDRLKKRYGPSRDRYLELIREFPLRPLQSESDLDAATIVIHKLIDQDQLSLAEQEYLDVLSDLVEAYEDVHYPIEDVSEGAMIQSFLESRDISQAQLAKAVGIATSTISEILSGKRKLTRKQIEKLSAYFKVSPAVFHSTIS